MDRYRLVLWSCLLVLAAWASPADEHCTSSTSFIQTQSVVTRLEDPTKGLIPRTIVQTFRFPLGELPPNMEQARSTWETLNPDFKYRYFTDNEMNAYVLQESRSIPGLAEVFASLDVPAEKVDIFRFLLLYNEGGVFADIDMVLRRPLSELLNPNDQLVARSTGKGFLECDWLAAAPHHPVLEHVLKRTVASFKLHKIGKNGICVDCSLDALTIAGPFELTRSATDFFFPKIASSLPPGANSWKKFRPGCYTSPDKAARLRVSWNAWENSDISQKYKGYESDLKRKGVEHWKERLKADRAVLQNSLFDRRRVGRRVSLSQSDYQPACP